MGSGPRAAAAAAEHDVLVQRYASRGGQRIEAAAESVQLLAAWKAAAGCMCTRRNRRFTRNGKTRAPGRSPAENIAVTSSIRRSTRHLGGIVLKPLQDPPVETVDDVWEFSENRGGKEITKSGEDPPRREPGAEDGLDISF
ncbi:hypothetical protein CYMTET_48266 [Cymbomonas tetramitiformis]|uniref:Uncharacterized protein n=1 Tax=Cymbomonas tetramitiformis TaxID=36881 RepID=A0AAE0EVS7_9CHLO|nr:hypothetical protein CYMTET_48266 [Cymbomonas tetramitiformis]